MLYLTAEDYTNMSYYNLCGISYRSQHSNISKRKKRGGGVLVKKITGMQDSNSQEREK
jgi:hypothetical protein